MDTLATWAAIVSSLAAVFGLFYAGYQFKQNSRATRQSMYITWLDKYLHLKELVLEYPELDDIYNNEIDPNSLASRQLHYIFSVIAFCEALYQTDQIKSFPREVPGSSWENFIIHQLSTPTIRGVWRQETSDANASDFTFEFIKWVDRKLP